MEDIREEMKVMVTERCQEVMCESRKVLAFGE
jgi:hypothetical protein